MKLREPSDVLRLIWGPAGQKEEDNAEKLGALKFAEKKDRNETRKKNPHP
jgi:hypothetical protein